MYPNPQDVVPLPPSPDAGQYRTVAKDLVEAATSDAPADAIRAWAGQWPEQAPAIERFARETLAGRRRPLTGAQLVVARLHGFESWPKFAAHLHGLASPVSPVSHFEAAVDAIVGGDLAALQRLLREQPAIVRSRATREHRATLLIYTAANGVENYRQKTPPNIVAIADALLDAGAEVDAEAEVYGGGCTALGLAATSIHPERAGVQNALMQLLIDRGAMIDRARGVGRTHSFVVGCLANGRAAAAEYLAAHGARLDLDGAAGIGRLDVVQRFVNPDGTPAVGATTAQIYAGFMWACEFGRTAVVEFLLDRGMSMGASARPDGQTGLHRAALGGHGDIVSLLLARNAPVNAVETTFQGTPLKWALYGWGNARTPAERDHRSDVVARLVRAGASVDPKWLREDPDDSAFDRSIRADAQMLAALRTEP